MRRQILPILLPLALLAACSKSEPPAEKPAPTPPAKEESRPKPPETPPVRAEGSFPPGFPYDKLDAERIGASTSFFSEGIQHYEVGLDSDLDAEAVADHWQNQLETHGVQVVRQRVEEPGRVRIVLQGEDDSGRYSRVSVLQNVPEGDEGKKSPSKVNVYIGKR